MLIAGHMVLAYFLTQLFVKRWHIHYSLPLLLAAAVLPDLDFIFFPIVTHHTLTHSITFWLPICVGLILIKRLEGIPYVVAIMSHFLIGDIITGNPTLLYGFSDQTFVNFRSAIISQFGQEIGMLYWSAVDAIMVCLFGLYAVWKKNIPSIFLFSLKHVLVLGIVVLAIFIGTLKSQLLYVSQSQNEITYAAYAMIILSQTVFAVMMIRGTERNSLRVPTHRPAP